jgi:hypothetical protein
MYGEERMSFVFSSNSARVEIYGVVNLDLNGDFANLISLIEIKLLHNLIREMLYIVVDVATSKLINYDTKSINIIKVIFYTIICFIGNKVGGGSYSFCNISSLVTDGLQRQKLILAKTYPI